LAPHFSAAYSPITAIARGADDWQPIVKPVGVINEFAGCIQPFHQRVTAMVPVTFKTQVTAEHDADGAGRHLASLRRGPA
jgi:hypothetical protein